ncbi:VOC family protein [Rhizobium favelukesii]|uniref:Glyoxalase/fosfomycin resistance/dioxygenase domain-containing protein n=1 Tax=Rhizobium favelukesii TaxID=348824 RepID=W6RXE5_9HYPH|nr:MULTISPECIES: VOC family protein [Rhizobium]MCA0804996.1 VOC family protein [Rhizobium sp. T1473]MCS0459064.1 VOC family protein [Rhizobium favelukesii]CDM63263.1 hypothetical protein LPU83_pLPU83d_1893 [Rhizobium favelukesii]
MKVALWRVPLVQAPEPQNGRNERRPTPPQPRGSGRAGTRGCWRSGDGLSAHASVGIAIWFGCDDADELHAHLCERDVRIAFPPRDNPFGRYFAFVDPFGYTITAHTLSTK